LSTRGLGKAAV